MSDSIKILNLGHSGTISWKSALEEKGFSVEVTEAPKTSGDDQLKTQVSDHDLTFLNSFFAPDIQSWVHHRSVDSHFLDYIDFIENREGQLWGHSLFTSIFTACLLQARQNQDYKGSVIFLGENPRILAALGVLAKFGFTDFDFLGLSDKSPIFDHVGKNMGSLFDTKIAGVDSASFVRSPKEYSLCFVADDNYSPQTLEDMSYFHFLSTNSMVFDFSGQSNFLFKEVRALGVDLFTHEQISEVEETKKLEAVLAFAQKMSANL